MREGESFRTARNESAQDPMDFAIITGWKACCTSHFCANLPMFSRPPWSQSSLGNCKKGIEVILPWSLRRMRNTFPFTSNHTSPSSPLSLALSLMVSGPAPPPVDMCRTLAQRATQSAPLGRFTSLYYNDVLWREGAPGNCRGCPA